MKNRLLALTVVLLMAGIGATSCDTLKPPPHPAGLKSPPKPPTP